MIKTNSNLKVLFFTSIILLHLIIPHLSGELGFAGTDSGTIENIVEAANPPSKINMGVCPNKPYPKSGKIFLKENFDSYTSGTLLKSIKHWELLYYAAENPEKWKVVGEKDNPANKSLYICADRFKKNGGNAEYYSESGFGKHILLKAQIKAAGLSGGGAYKTDVGIDIKPRTGKYSIASVFVHSKKDNNIPEGLILTSNKFNYYKIPVNKYKDAAGKWIDIAIEIDPAEQKAHFWVDKIYQGFLIIEFDIPARLVLFSGDGGGWIDNLEISEIKDTAK